MSLEVHVLASGSDGNCTVVKFEDRAVMIDAGLSFKKIKGLMDVSGIDESCIESILITHEHNDHITGAGPTARKLDVPLVCIDRTFNAFNHGDVRHRSIRMLEQFQEAGMRITPLPTMHDAAEPCSFCFEADGKIALIATDTGRLTQPVEHVLAKADIAVIESNYDKHMLEIGPYPLELKRRIDSDIGHMCNVATGEAVKRTMGVNPRRQIFLAHLSRKNNMPDIARETVSEVSGVRRSKLDCLEFQGDTRVLRA